MLARTHIHIYIVNIQHSYYVKHLSNIFFNVFQNTKYFFLSCFLRHLMHTIKFNVTMYNVVQIISRFV